MTTLSEKAHHRLNDEALIRERDLWVSRMEAVYHGTPDSYNEKYVYMLWGKEPRPSDPLLAYRDPEEWVRQSLELMAELEVTGENRFLPWCFEYHVFGVHFIDRIFDADVFHLEDPNTFYEQLWNARYLKTPVGTLKMPDLEHNETWSMAKRAANAFLEADVRLPFYGTPVLSSPLNIFLNLYGEEALVALMEEPEAAEHDLGIITEVIRTLHRWHREHIPEAQLQGCITNMRTAPPGYGQICGCSTQLLSGPLYAKVIAPLDDAILGEYPHGGMIHLCGTHTQHIPTFRGMKHLASVQLNDAAADELEAYVRGLREDQVIYLNPSEKMPIPEAVRVSGGKRIILCIPENAPAQPGRAENG